MGQHGLSPLPQAEAKRERRLLDFDLLVSIGLCFVLDVRISFQCETRPLLHCSLRDFSHQGWAATVEERASNYSYSRGRCTELFSNSGYSRGRGTERP